MGKIHILDQEVSNKIAAGEVVERPVSVVKELVENSIDAGADMIVIEIKNGGSTYLRVTDNGSGMAPEDAQVAFLRHATSKIQTDADLDAIYTLGFRGEALSSIGAVAQVELRTKQPEAATGTLVTCEGGEIIASEEAGIPDGTSVTVQNLFYNTPARMKFLKKDRVEAGYITDLVGRFILAHPEISFKLLVGTKEQLFSSGDNNPVNAVYSVYGRDYAKAVLPVQYQNEHIKISGLVGKGTLSRPNRNYQSFFVNHRYIKSAMLIRALEEAYKNQVMIGKFPMAVLNIEINPAMIDINVHPTKLEVKFSEEKLIYETVYYGVKNALYQTANIPEISRGRELPEEKTPQKMLSDLVNDLPKEVPQQNPFVRRENPFLKKQQPPAQAVSQAHTVQPKEPPLFMQPQRQEPPLQSPIVDGTVPAEQAQKEHPAEGIKEKTVPEKELIEAEVVFRVIGQVFQTYILIEKEDQLLLMDQHAAHERLNYEALCKNMEQSHVLSQMLIEPLVVNLSATEMAAFLQNQQVLSDLGFESEEFGDAVLIRSVPGEIEWGEAEALFVELLTQLQQDKKEVIGEKAQRGLYTIACKAAVKANKALSPVEMEALVRDVLRLPNINTCPHGRPILISMSKKEIEKEFKRIV